MRKNAAFERFKEEFPLVGESFSNLYQAVSNKGLDPKTKELIYLGVLTTVRYSPAILVHMNRALDLGATKDEVVEAMMMSIPASGLCNFLDILPEVLNELDQRKEIAATDL